jgi:hypothetical protein
MKLRQRLAAKVDYLANIAPPLTCCPHPSGEYHVYAAGFFNSLGLFLRNSQAEIDQMYSDFDTILIGIPKLDLSHLVKSWA